jgi:hypothetical protein
LSPAANAIARGEYYFIPRWKTDRKNTDWIGFTNDLSKFLLEDIPASDRKALVLAPEDPRALVVFCLNINRLAGNSSRPPVGTGQPFGRGFHLISIPKSITFCWMKLA